MGRDFLIIEACDFAGYPSGGQTQQAIMLMKAFADRVALVGITTGDSPVGKWVERKIGGRSFRYFSIGRREKRFSRPLIPSRIVGFSELFRYRKAILSLGIRRALIQAPELLMACSHWGWESVCYWFPGVNNPLTVPRYRWGKALKMLFPQIFFRVLRNADVILAQADDRSISRQKELSSGLLDGVSILKFPTRFDPDIFHPVDRTEAKKRFGFPYTSPMVVMVGRISRAKGWRLLLDAFKLFSVDHPGASMVYVGDGEDRKPLESRIKEYGLEQRVTVTGFMPQEEVSAYLKAADLVVVGSVAEGWSTSMAEALACGCSIVSTDVSGARDMIVPGGNGFIVKERSPESFAAAMVRSIGIPGSREVSIDLSQKYSVRNMKGDLCARWKAIGGDE